MRTQANRGFVVPAILAWTALALADLAAGGGASGVRVVASTLGLAVGTGVVFGLAWELAIALVALLPRFAAWIVWPAAGIAAGAVLAEDLGAFGKLTGHYRAIAILTLAACAVIGLLAGLLAASMQRGRRGADPLAFRLRGRWRTGLAAALLAAMAVVIYLDRTRYQGLYEDVHLVMRLLAAWFATLAAALASGLVWRPARAVRVAFALACAALVVLPFAMLTEKRESDLQKIARRPMSSMALEAMRAISDVDGDHFSSLLGGGDCAPFDPRVNPGAEEIAGNGIDDNCLGGDQSGRRQTIENPKRVPIPKEPSPMSVVLIVLDAVRADHTGPYGYKRATVPNVAVWAKNAIVFENTFTVGGWTSIAMPSIMHGVFARRLMWTRYAETSRYRLLKLPYESLLRPGEKLKNMYLLPPRDPRRTIAWWLKRRGMYTAAVINDGFSQMLSREVGTNEGYTAFEQIADVIDRRKGDEATADAALKMLERLKAKPTFFFWTHFFCTHRPYRRTADSIAFGTSVPDKYDSQLAVCDKQVGRVLDALAGGGFRSKVAVVVAADHGEGIHETMNWHGDSVREDLLRVPLMMAVPGMEPRRVAAPVSMIDFFPTILALTRTPAPRGLDGVDLMQVARGIVPRRPSGLIADNWQVARMGHIKQDLTCAFDGKLKLVYDRRSKVMSLVSQEQADADRNELLASPEGRKLRSTLFQYLEESGGPVRIEN
jgi:arylsulfatase A-like enzyme